MNQSELKASCNCAVPENIHTHPIYERSLEIPTGGRGGGVLKAKFLEAMYENKQKFSWGAGAGVQEQKILPWGEYGYFLELHAHYRMVSSMGKCEQALLITTGFGFHSDWNGRE